MQRQQRKRNNYIGLTVNDRTIAIDKKIEQWIFVGPLLMVAAFLVLLFTPIRPIAISLVAIAGLPLCWKWRLKGAALATSILAALLIYQLMFLSHPQPFWQFSMAATLTLTLWITALCSQEVEELFSSLQNSSEPATTKFQAIKNELSLLTKKKSDEQKIAEAAIVNLKTHIHAQEKQIASQAETNAEFVKQTAEIKSQFDNLQQALSDSSLENTLLKKNCDEQSDALLKKTVELESLQAKCTALLAEGSYLNARESLQVEEIKEAHATISLLEQKLTENERLLQGKSQELHDYLKGYRRVEEQNVGLLQEIFQRRHECTLLKQHSEELSESMQIKLEEAVSMADQKSFDLIAEVEAKQRVIQEQEQQLFKLQQDLELHQQELSECRQKAEELVAICAQKESLLVEQLEKAQNVVPDRQLRKLEGLYKQLKEQFNEKSDLLDSTRQDLFAANEELTKAQRELTEKDIEGKSAEYAASLEKQLEKTTEELIALEKLHQEEIETLQGVIQSLSTTQAPELTSTDLIPLETSKTAPKGRTPKKTKTTNWANTILSRCAEPAE